MSDTAPANPDPTTARLEAERQSTRAHALLSDVAAAGSLAAFAARKGLPVSAVRREVLAAQRHAGELDRAARKAFEAGLVACPICRGQLAPEGLSGPPCGFCGGEGAVYGAENREPPKSVEETVAPGYARSMHETLLLHVFGADAIEAARANLAGDGALYLHKFADPTEDALPEIGVAEATRVAAEDPSLVGLAARVRWLRGPRKTLARCGIWHVVLESDDLPPEEDYRVDVGDVDLDGCEPVEAFDDQVDLVELTRQALMDRVKRSLDH